MPHEPLAPAPSYVQTLSTSAATPIEAKWTRPVTSSSERFLEDKQVKTAIAGLWPYSPMRESATQVLQGCGPVTLYPMLDALRQPLSLNWREARVAAWALGRAPLAPLQKAEALAALTRVLRLSVSRSLLHKLHLTKLALVAATVTSWIVGLSGLIALSHDSGETTFWQIIIRVTLITIVCNVMFACVIVPLPYLLDCIHENRRWRVRAAIIKAMKHLTGAESVDLFVAALEDPAQAVRHESLQALFPLLTPIHRGQLRPYVITALCSDIENQSEDEILKRMDALEMVGDSRALKTMKHIQHYWQTERVRNRAVEVYSILEERQAQENAPKMLLRASHAGYIAPDTLLRAASENSLTEHAQLLRAAGDDEQV